MSIIYSIHNLGTLLGGVGVKPIRKYQICLFCKPGFVYCSKHRVKWTEKQSWVTSKHHHITLLHRRLCSRLKINQRSA